MGWLFLLFSEAGFADGADPSSTASDPAVSMNFLDSILSANLIVQLTFLILLLLSVVSWAVILQRHTLFKHIEKENSVFDDIFFKTGSFEEIYIQARSHEQSSLARIFAGGHEEMQKILKVNSSQDTTPSLSGLDNVERALRKETDNEIAFLETGLNFLATVGSSCPFIGLFGTVFGIMDAFSKIAVMESAALNVVAPGIAEALIATGLGLFAAIPAVIFYNSFVNRIKKFELKFNNFAVDFLNISKRNFFRGK